MEIITSYGPIFLTVEPRSSDLSKETLKAYPYKHHLETDIACPSHIVFDLDGKNNLVEDFSNPIAKINWRDGSVKILDRHVWNYLPEYVQDTIEQKFKEFWKNHQP